MMTDSEYKVLINRYFAGDTTVEGERLLLRELLERRPEPGSLEAEALAVMTFGRFQAPASASRRRRRLPRMRLWLSTAAAGLLAAFFAVSYFTARHSGVAGFLTGTDECTAWIDGRPVHDETLVADLMRQQLHEAAVASGELDSEVESAMGEIGRMSDFL